MRNSCLSTFLSTVFLFRHIISTYLSDIFDERKLKGHVQIDVIIFQHVLETNQNN